MKMKIKKINKTINLKIKETALRVMKIKLKKKWRKKFRLSKWKWIEK